MNIETYDNIWNIIKDTAIAINNDISSTKIEFSEFQKDEIYRRYSEFRDSLKIKHMGGLEARIDRHKVAACMGCAIMQAKPMQIKVKETDIRLAYFANECLSFFTALSIMRAFTKTVLEKKINESKEIEDGLDSSTLANIPNNILNKIIEDGYIFPKGKNNDYLLWQLMALNDVSDFRDYSLCLSNTLFIIEEYSILFYDNQNLNLEE